MKESKVVQSRTIKRMIIALAIILALYVVSNDYATHTTPYESGEVSEIFIQYCENDTARVAIREPAHVEAIISKMKRLTEDHEYYLCQSCVSLVFVGDGFEDHAASSGAILSLGIKGATSLPFGAPDDFNKLVGSYRDSLHMFEPWKGPLQTFRENRVKY